MANSLDWLRLNHIVTKSSAITVIAAERLVNLPKTRLANGTRRRLDFIIFYAMLDNMPKKSMTEDQRSIILNGLEPYGASLTTENYIQRDGKTTQVLIKVTGKRMRAELKDNLLFSGPIAESSIEAFVEKYWFWKKKA